MELLIPLDSRSKKPLYEQVYSHIRAEIRNGSLKAGERLPSTRVLAEHLKVSRSTTQMAYDQLLAEGYMEARPCRGYFVSHLEELVETGATGTGEMETTVEPDAGWRVDFSPRGIDLDSFPYHVWRKLSRNTLVDDNKEMFHSGNHQGEPGFREAIRSYLHSARGVNCSPEQIIVGAGSEYLLMLLSQILEGRHVIAMENPTYKQAYRVFQSLGYEVCPVEMDANGMEPELLAECGANVAYVMPSHQFPTGIVMPVGRRQELLKWAQEAPDRYIIEDDYDSEFRYRGKPIPSLQSSDDRGKVIYIGTFSKAIAPAIRVSYMVLPETLLEVYRRDCSFYSCTVSRIDQRILNEFIRDGYFERHLNKMRMRYRAKHDQLLEGLEPFQKKFRISGEDAGLHLLLTAKGNVTEKELLDAAAAENVKVYGMSENMVASAADKATVLLGFGSMDEADMKEGLRRLQNAWL